MLDIERELKYPLYDEKWLKKILIGGILNIIPVLCFFSWGYAYRILRQTLQGKEVLPLPSWDRWREDFIKGLMILLLVICWAAIPFIIIWKVNALLGLLAVAVAAILFPMALAYYASDESFADAFRVKKIWQMVRISWNIYARAWLACGVLFVVGLFIWRLPVIGYPVGAFLFFYVLLVYARLFGLASRSVLVSSAAIEGTAEGEQDASSPHSP